MIMYDKSIVASGHKYVSEATGEILAAGGNAFDGVVAAGFASAVSESALTSLGGGGLMVGHCEESGQNLFFDFFVDTPGKGREDKTSATDFFTVTVDFSGSLQEFNIGLGSVAVPGVLKGLLHIHKKLGRMPLGEVIAPAKELALGHRLNVEQAHFLELLRPILTQTKRGRCIYQPNGRFLRPGDRLKNLATADFLDQLIAEGDESFYRGEIAAKIDQEMRLNGGFLTAKDLCTYEVKERQPLSIPYRDYTFLTAAEPSMGGSLICLSLSLLAGEYRSNHAWGTSAQLANTVGLMKEVERLRGAGITSPAALRQFLQNGELMAESAKKIKQFNRGTTHISIADKMGNCASMTCSNGEGSGYLAPVCGVMLNNMMGEDDLHPQGFHASEPGERVFSMMSPSILLQEGHARLVIGSGGSKRIRTAISQVLNQVIDFDRSLQQAVAAPRLHLDGDCLQMEPGFDPTAVDALKAMLPVNIWLDKNVYFGGVHVVAPGVDGAGDHRRGGAVVTVSHKEKR